MLFALPANLLFAGEAKITPPAVPLVACDPYFSIWSQSPTLTDVDTTHWTGKSHRLSSLVRIDGKTHRLMGAKPSEIPALPQTNLEITPTQTIYQFEGAGIEVSLRFTTPLLPNDIDLLSRPITYLTYTVRATDGESHAVSLYFDASAELTVNDPTQEEAVASVSSIRKADGAGKIASIKIGSVVQRILQRKGDDLRIDWGYLYIAAPSESLANLAVGGSQKLQDSFCQKQTIVSDSMPATLAKDAAGMVMFDLPKVGSTAVSRWLMLAYDDLYSIQFMKKDLRPYWRRDGMDAEELLRQSEANYTSLLTRCDAFDEELTNDLRNVGGEEYAALAGLAYRQCFAAGKFVADANGQPIEFCKENNSNGCIATSDVFYPMSPQFLLFGPSLAKSFIAPFMEYAASDRWTFPFAPHDLGTYPKANGQVYGGGEHSEENQMPVEESGNMLILMAAVAQMEGHTTFADRYWPQLEQWANYLQEEGFDPDNQLCTDDFAGHLAHNVNLSAKAICGLGAYAKLCEMRGDDQQARKYQGIAKKFAEQWVEEAADGDHFRLTFDRPGTWSQKYNLVWDRLLGLDLFPQEVLEKEMAYYRHVQNRYGLPLDSRDEYTKLDWVLWTASLTDNREDFEALVHPVFKFLNETPDRVPMTDWYRTKTGRQVGFKARPVVGGVFMRLLYDKAVWSKWSDRDQTGAGDYAPMPQPPKTTVVVPAADEKSSSWRYTQRTPQGNWQSPDFDDSSWQIGRSGFGAKGTPNARIGTKWESRAIWLRRQLDIGSFDQTKGTLKLNVHFDEDAEIYLNGVLAASLHGYTTDYERAPIRKEALATLQPSGNTIAVYCRNTTGGQFIDVGLILEEVAESKELVSAVD